MPSDPASHEAVTPSTDRVARHRENSNHHDHHSGSVGGGGHEHGGFVGYESLVDERALGNIQRVLLQAGGANDADFARFQTLLTALFVELDKLDWLAGVARRLVVGDLGARRLFAAWLSLHEDELESERRPHERRDDHGAPMEEVSGHVHEQRDFSRGADCDLLHAGPLADLIVGAAYDAAGNDTVFERQLRTITKALQRALPPLILLHDIASRSLRSFEGAESLRAVLAEFGNVPGFPDKRPPLDLGFLDELNFCLNELSGLTAC